VIRGKKKKIRLVENIEKESNGTFLENCPFDRQECLYGKLVAAAAAVVPFVVVRGNLEQ
jgi:hypothetical protein